MLSLNFDGTLKFINENELKEFNDKAIKALDYINNKNGKGSDFLGWHDYPISFDREEYLRIIKASQTIRNNSDVLVVVGIGGSYLGAKAVIEALKPYYNYKGVEVVFAGNSISSEYLSDLLDYLKDKDFSVNVISKSGTTTEPAIAYRLLLDLLKKKYKTEDLKNRIFFTTDKEFGALRKIGLENNYEMFVVPSDMGGRYSVFSAVGLLPIAVSGFDCDKLLEGAQDSFKDNLEVNSKSYNYAIYRNALLNNNYNIEILESYEPKLSYLNEWFKQLFGESEGKEYKGIYPSSCIFTTDLHSMGQYIQEGRRNLFETLIRVKSPIKDLNIPTDELNLDNLNYLAAKKVSEVNDVASLATKKAHIDGGVPVIEIDIDKIDEYNIGYLLYFFMKACAISGYILGINPFNQPGVEEYKTNMFKMLGKPGYEK